MHVNTCAMKKHTLKKYRTFKNRIKQGGEMLKAYDVDKEKNLTPNRMLKIKENIQQRIFDAMQNSNQEDARQARHELRTLPW